MPLYETVCVVKPDVQGERLTKITEKLQKVLSDFKVKDVNKSDWGIRRLAYPIENYKSAHYLYFTFDGQGGLVAELERQFSYDDAILRYMTMKVRKDGRTDIKPDNFQFGKVELDSNPHPFGGYEGRERRPRRPRMSRPETDSATEE